jgi:transposase-like protein
VGTRKQIVAVAVEKPTGHIQWGYGRCRLRVIPNAQRETLEDFITDVCEPGSVIYTDGHGAYARLDEIGYTHVISHLSSDEDPAHVNMPAVHRVASLLKRWLLGTHQGSVAAQHLDSDLDEFTFRFNRRRSPQPRPALLPADRARRPHPDDRVRDDCLVTPRANDQAAWTRAPRPAAEVRGDGTPSARDDLQPILGLG